MPDLERQLRDLFERDARSRRVTNVRVGQRGRLVPLLAGATGAVVVLVLAAALGLALARHRSASEPVAVPATPTAPPASPAAGGCVDTGRRERSLGLSATVAHATVTIEEISGGGNIAAWRVRYFIHGDAPGPATIRPQAAISGGPEPVAVLNHAVGHSPGRPMREFAAAEQVAPCTAFVEQISTGRMRSGTYTLTLGGLSIAGRPPEPVSIVAALDCTGTSSCIRAEAVPTPSPVDRELLRSDSLVVYGGLGSYMQGGAPVVKRETDGTPIGALADSFFGQVSGEVSPDGRRLAYWAAPRSEPWAIYVLDGPTLQQTKVVEIGRDRPGVIRPNGLVWSSDGTGLLFATTDSNQGTRPTFASLRTLDLASGAQREVLRLGEGSWLGPVAWDRAADVIAAAEVVHRELGALPSSNYHVIAQGRPRVLAGSVKGASPDARSILLAIIYDSREGVHAAQRPSALRIAPVGDPGASRELVREDGVFVVGWRRAGEIVIATPRGMEAHYERLDTATGARRPIGTYPLAGGPTAMRPDGSAFVIERDRGRSLLVDVETGRATELPRDPEGRRVYVMLSAR